MTDKEHMNAQERSIMPIATYVDNADIDSKFMCRSISSAWVTAPT